MNTLSQHIQLTPRVKPRSLSLRSLSTIEASKGRHLIILLSLMLITGAVMAQRTGTYPNYPSATLPHVTVGGDVFGGGNKADVAGKSSVTLDHAGDSIYGSVYGGGALANVGTVSDDITTVNILNGIVNGNVYGGGLGDSLKPEYGYNGSVNKAAFVRGKVYVTIGQERGGSNPPYSFAKINGSVFGCNNINGTPLDSVFVNVYRTWHSSINYYPSDTITSTSFENMEKLRRAAIIANADENYAIKNVYGGGNRASYKPALNGNNTHKCTTVHIYYCDENTIKTVYGGGNAADAGTTAKPADTHLIIDGGRFDRIFGGGNGYSSATPPNHTDPNGEDYNPGANIFGSATTDFNGGLCNQLFGGSNQYGNIATANLNINRDPDGCIEMILESFCGGNEANMTGGDINATIANCDIRIGTLYGGSNNAHILKDNNGNGGNVTLNVLGGTYDYVFGGSKGVSDTPANIEGNVTLNLHGGTISSAYGGSDVNGNIKGIITVNVLDTVTPCPLQVDTVYGAGRDAAYTPDNLASGEKPVSPNVKIQHATIGHGTGDEAVPGCVFGGGKGATATVTAHPYVIIGELSTLYYPDGTTEIPTRATVTGDVYGGGNAADVVGGTTVLVQKCNSSYAKYVYGGGNAAKVDSTKVYITGGTIDTLFGGGHGSITSNVSANVTYHDTISITGGTIGKAFSGSNLKGSIGGRMALNIDKSSATGACALKIGEVYGGGNMAAGRAGTITIGCTGTWTTGEGNTHEHHNHTTNRIGYELEGIGTVYGGANMAAVNDDIYLLINSGIIDTIFGGNNQSGVISGSIQVDIDKDNDGACASDWYVGNVYGGGNQAPYGSAGNAYPKVNILNGTVSYNVFGGGLGSTATVTGNPVVNLNGGTVNGNTFGGGSAAPVSGNPIVNALKGVANNVYGGGLGATAIVTGNPSVIVNQASGETMTINNVFGGGDAAAVTGNTTVQLQAGAVTNAFGGGNQAGVSNNASVTVSGGSVSTGLYGGCNTSGNVGGDITVNVTGGTIGANGAPAYFHGGGYGNGTSTSGDVDVTINGATVVIWGDVYGGSAKGNVNAAGKETNVTLEHGTIHGDLYGGGLGDGTYAALVNGAVQVTVNGGTVTGSIYGCNNVNGAPQSTVKVDIYDTDHPGSGFAIGHVFGGGNAADFGGKPQVTIHNCDNSIEYVYGGGNAATVTGTEVLVYGGNSIGNVFGGCYGADVTTGGTDVKIRGGKIGKVFGGNNHHGSITGNIKVDIDKQIEPGDGHTLCDMIIGEVYGGGNEAPSQAGAITIGCTGDIVPGANGHIALPENIGTTLEGIGKVYGGANKASITSGDISLNIKSGIVGTVFGGNNISGEIANAIQVKINKTGDACGWYVGDVYGGGDQAWYGGTPVVRIQNGTVYGNVYGGGNNITIDNKGVAASDVEMTGGTVLGGIYGGCNLKGYVVGNSVVNILGGTIGSQDLLDHNKTADVFGGGLGEQTRVNGNVTVTISRATGENPPAAPTIYGDVYGGSALGNVNTQNGGNTTTVNIYDGTLITKRTSTTENGQTIYYYTGGNVFGGGLGRKADPANNITAIPAKVYGAVTVNIGAGTPGPQEDGTHFTGNATIGGNIYGANNTNGSPQDDITVNVYRTAHTDGTGGTVDNTVNGTAFAIANVFGGGNEANYAPQNGAQNTTKKSKVNIYGCYNTINRVFGGGNAASTPSVWTEIQGGRFYQVFGGGNGERGASYGADINGRLDLFIHGGNVGQFYGASNQNGNISPGPINVVVDSNGPCGSNLTIDEFFCGGNFADINTNLETTIDCSNGMQVNNLYGGCNQANISGHVILNLYGGTYINVYGGSKGDTITLGPDHINKRADIGEYVTLNLYGGTITNVYGGSNVNGNIKGAITVNVIDNEGDCPLYITNIYGGSNMTSYKPTDATIQSPVVNVVHAKYGISGNVYGGSKGVVGSAAVVKANPLVNIGYDSSMAGYIPSAYNVSSYNRMTTIQGSVFGGCDAAKVIGNTEVQLKKGARVIGNVYGGGNMGEVEGDTKVIVNGKME